MRIEFDVPETYATAITPLAEAEGLTPTQWVIRLLKTTLRPPQTPQSGRPAVNADRDATITQKRRAGVTAAALAREYGVSEIRIHQICRAGR
jgi:hypothetical protein